MYDRLDETRCRSKKKRTGNGAVMRAKVRKAEAKAKRLAEEEATAKSLGFTPVELRAIRYNEANLHRPKGSTIVPRPTQKERQRLFLHQQKEKLESAGRGATP